MLALDSDDVHVWDRRHDFVDELRVWHIVYRDDAAFEHVAQRRPNAFQISRRRAVQAVRLLVLLHARHIIRP